MLNAYLQKKNMQKREEEKKKKHLNTLPRNT